MGHVENLGHDLFGEAPAGGGVGLVVDLPGLLAVLPGQAHLQAGVVCFDRRGVRACWRSVSGRPESR
jgi:hypothetical protein